MIRILYLERSDDKTCPFCGHKDLEVCTEAIRSHTNGPDAPCSTERYVFMECLYCLARSPRKTVDTVYDSENVAAAREVWNTRAEGVK